MTRVEILNFPSKFAVFRRRHNSLAFQIILSNELYADNNTYFLENENIENSSMFQHFENISLTMLPYENNSTVHILCQQSDRRYRVCWNCSGLFIKINRDRISNPVITIPILTISDYSILPPITQNSICFIEDIFPHSIRNILTNYDGSEINQWLHLEQLLCNWFNYSHRSASPLLSRHSGGPDDHDDRRSIPQSQLVGAIPRNRRRTRERLNLDSDEESYTSRQRERLSIQQRNMRHQEHQVNTNFIGAGGGLSHSTSNSNPIRLQKFTVDAIIDYAINTETTCPISMELITRQNAGVLSCQHIFAKDSIERWLATNNVCPLCRESSVLC